MSGMSKGGKAGTLTQAGRANLEDHVIRLAWSPDGRRLACAAVGGPIHVLDADGLKTLHTFSGHGFGTADVAWSADGAHLASAGQDGTIKLWDLDSDRERLALPAGAAWAERVAWCPVVNLLAGAAGRKVRLWDVQGKMVREYPDHPATVADIAWQPRAEILATACYGQLNLWRTDSPEPFRRFEWKGSMLVLAWSPNGRYLATGDQDSTVHFWIIKTGEDLMMSGYPTKVKELSWDSTSRYLATGGGAHCCVWDCSGKGPAGTRPIQLEAHTDRLTAVAFRHGSPILATGGADAQVALWQIGKRKEPLSVEFLPSAVTQLAWSPDDKHLASGCADGHVVLYRFT